MAEKKDPTAMLQSIKEQREKARAEPPRVNPVDGKVMSRPQAPRVPFSKASPHSSKTFKAARLSAAIREVEVEAVRHLSMVTGMSQRSIIETALRNHINTLDPQLIAEIEQVLSND